MKTTTPKLPAWLALVALSGVLVAGARDNKPVAAPALASNAVTPEVPIPQSVFNVTNLPTKDPFFPLTTRSPFPAAPRTTNAPVVPAPELYRLKMLSGIPGNRLALINNCNLAEGEEGDIVTPTGKFRIKCLKIGDVSVTIQVPGHTEPIEIFLPRSAR